MWAWCWLCCGLHNFDNRIWTFLTDHDSQETDSNNEVELAYLHLLKHLISSAPIKKQLIANNAKSRQLHNFPEECVTSVFLFGMTFLRNEKSCKYQGNQAILFRVCPDSSFQEHGSLHPDTTLHLVFGSGCWNVREVPNLGATDLELPLFSGFLTFDRIISEPRMFYCDDR